MYQMEKGKEKNIRLRPPHEDMPVPDTSCAQYSHCTTRKMTLAPKVKVKMEHQTSDEYSTKPSVSALPTSPSYFPASPKYGAPSSPPFNGIAPTSPIDLPDYSDTSPEPTSPEPPVAAGSSTLTIASSPESYPPTGKKRHREGEDAEDCFGDDASITTNPTVKNEEDSEIPPVKKPNLSRNQRRTRNWRDKGNKAQQAVQNGNKAAPASSTTNDAMNRKPMWEHLKGEIKAELKRELSTELRGQIKADIWKELKAKLKNEIRGELRAELKGELKRELKDEMRREQQQQPAGMQGPAARPPPPPIQYQYGYAGHAQQPRGGGVDHLAAAVQLFRQQQAPQAPQAPQPQQQHHQQYNNGQRYQNNSNDNLAAVLQFFQQPYNQQQQPQQQQPQRR